MSERQDNIIARAEMQDVSLSSGLEKLRGEFQQLNTSAKSLSAEHQSAGKAVEEAGGKFAGLKEQTHDLATEFQSALIPGVGGVALGVTALTATFAEATKAASAERVIIGQLDVALKDNIPNWDGNRDAIEAVIEKRKEMAYDDDVLRQSLATLVPFTHNVTTAFNLQAIAMDLARGKNIDLATASQVIGRVYEGHVAILNRYGIAVQKGATAVEALAQVQKTYAGQAEQYANSEAGAADKVKNSWDDLLKSVGNAAPLKLGLDAVRTLIDAVQHDLNTVGGAIKSFSDAFIGTYQQIGDAVFHNASAQQDAAATVISAVDAMGREYSTQAGEIAQDLSGCEVAFNAFSDAANKSTMSASDSFVNFTSVMHDANAVADNVSKGMQDDLQSLLDKTNSVIDDTSTKWYGMSSDQRTVQANIAAELANGLQALQLWKQGNLDECSEVAAVWGNTADQIIGRLRQIAVAAQEAIGLANAAARQPAYQPGFAPGPTTLGQPHIPNFNPYTMPEAPTPDPNSPANMERNKKGYDDQVAALNKVAAAHAKSAAAAEKAAEAARKHAEALAEQAAKATEGARREEDMAKAEDLVTIATGHLKDVTQEYDTILQGYDTHIKQVGQDEQGALAKPTKELAEAQDIAAYATRKYDDELHGLQVQMHGLEGEMKQLQQSSADALKPFELEVEKAQAALDALRQETVAGDQEFERMAHALNEQLTSLQNQAESALAPFQAALDAANAALQAVQREASETSYQYGQQLEPLQNQLYDQQKAAEDLAATYADKLNPLQAELNALHAADAAQQRTDQIHAEQTAVENLSARLATATGAQREQIAAQLAAAQSKLGRSAREDSLEGQISVVEKARDDAMQVVNAQVKATADEIKAIEHERDLKLQILAAQVHAAELQQQAAQEAYNLQQALWAQREAVVQDELAMIQHRREEFDYEQAQQEQQSQQKLTDAQAQLTTMQEVTTKMLGYKQQQVDALTELQAKKQWEADESARLNNQVVAGYQALVDQTKAPFEAMKTDLGRQRDLWNEAKTAAVNSAKDQVTAAGDVKTALDKAWQTVDKYNGYVKDGASLTKDQANAFRDAKNEIDKLEPKLGNLNTAYGALNGQFKTANADILSGVTSLWQPDKKGTTDLTSVMGVYNKGLQNLSDQTHTSLDWDRLNIWEPAMTLVLTTVTGGMTKVAGEGGKAAHSAGESLAQSLKDGIAAGFTSGGLTVQVDFSVSGGTGTTGTSGQTSGLSLPGFATGGIVNGPTIALIGENGPEAVIPLGRAYGPAMGGVGANVNIEMNFQTAGRGLSPSEADESARNIMVALQRYSVLTGRA